MSDKCCSGPGANGLTAWEEHEKAFLVAKVEDCKRNLSAMARHMRISLPTLRKKLRRYDIYPNIPKHEKPA